MDRGRLWGGRGIVEREEGTGVVACAPLSRGETERERESSLCERGWKVRRTKRPGDAGNGSEGCRSDTLLHIPPPRQQQAYAAFHHPSHHRTPPLSLLSLLCRHPSLHTCRYYDSTDDYVCVSSR